MADCGPALALMGLCFLFMWFVGGLSGFHCYLVGSNQTTYENFRCESGGGVGGPGRGGGAARTPGVGRDVAMGTVSVGGPQRKSSA